MANDSAVEALLSDLLKESRAQGKEQSAVFLRLAKASGLDPKLIKESENRLKALGDAAEETATSTRIMSKAGNVVGAVLADLVGGVTNTIGNLAKFAGTTLSGNAKMSDLFMAFKDLPIVGVVAGLFGQLVKMQEENLTMYRNLSSSGINFGSNLSSLRQDFLELGLTSDQYTQVLKENSDIFTLMGASVTAGAKNFKGINKELLANQSGLLNLGFSYQEISGTIASFARGVGGLTKQQQEDYKGTAASVAAYAKEVDLLARLTGQDRAALQKKIEKEQQEANWQAFLTTLPKEARARLMSMVANADATMGEAGTQIVKAQAMGIAVQGEAGQYASAMARQSTELLRRMTDDAVHGNKTSQQFAAESATRIGKLQFQSANDIRGLVPLFNAMAQGGSPIPGHFNQMSRNFSTLNDNMIITEAQSIARAQAESAQQKLDAEAADKQLQAQLKAEEKIRDFSAALNKLTGPIIEHLLMPVMGLLSTHMETLTTGMKNLAPLMADFIKNLFTPTGRQKIIDDTVALLSELFAGVMEKTGLDKKLPSAIKTAENTAIGAGTGLGLAGAGVIAAAILGAPLTGGVSLAALLAATAVGGAVGYNMDSKPGRAFGTLGSTGRLFENYGNGTQTTLHGTEGVFTPSQISSLMSGASAESSRQLVEQLNNTNAQMLSLMRELVDNSRKNVDATKSLSGNAFA